MVWFVVGVFIAVIWGASWVSRKAAHQWDGVLDDLFRTFSLQVRDPYVLRPGFTEKRCHHCGFPQVEGHAATCTWLRFRGAVQRFYRT